jgi:N-acetylglucosamine transport system substrate-binding protein
MNRIRTALALVLTLSVLASLTACGAPPSPTSVQPEESQVPAETEAVTTETPEEVTLEVAVESAGYGIELYEQMAREFEAAHPGVTVNLWGVPEIWNQLQPRFVAGNPPDLVAAVQLINHAALIEEGQILPLNDVLNSPAAGQEGTNFIDTVVPGMLQGGAREGNYYLFPWNAMTYGVFYNIALFEEHGWQVPTSWDELVQLCDQVEETDIACIAFPGVWPEYFTLTSWWDLIERIGGRQAQLAMENLEPGAWGSDTVVQVNGLIQGLAVQGFFQDGWQGQDHTVAQTLFVTGGAAMNFNGAWLEAEMRDITPADFQMGFFPTPGVQGGLGDRTSLRVGSDWWFIPAQAQHSQLAGEFLKFVFSVDNARRFVDTTHSLSPIIGSTEGAQVTPALAATMAAVENATVVRPWYWQVNYYGLYDLMATEVMGQLLRQEITPAQMAERLEGLAEEIRNDDTITKVTIVD